MPLPRIEKIYTWGEFHHKFGTYGKEWCYDDDYDEMIARNRAADEKRRTR